MMHHALRLLRLLAVLAAMSLVIGDSLAANGGAPKRVLLIHSFGREFSPYDKITAVFRTELAKQFDGPVVFLESTLDAGRTMMQEEERAFVDYLRNRFAASPPDLVVTIGPPAARFYVTYREKLFPSPLMIAALDERLARSARLRAGDAAVVGKVDIPGLYDNILRVLPETKTIAFVIGASPLERFWLKEAQKEAEPFRARAEFLWLGDLSLEQIRERIAQLPPRSAVLFTLMIVDAAGVPYERLEALTALRSSSSAPIFSIYESELGQGVVGGPYSSQRGHGERMALAAHRILRGVATPEPVFDVSAFETPVYDARELERWRIDPARLPPGSEVRFRPAGMWEDHAGAIVAGSAVIVLQAALIAALLLQRRRRRRAEQEASRLGGRLITAHEDERRRLARELHDDVSQRLAAMAIQAAKLEVRRGGPDAREPAHAIREGLIALSDDVHSFSYRLHPTVIEDLGLVEALRAECDRVSRSASLPIELDATAVPASCRPMHRSVSTASRRRRSATSCAMRRRAKSA